MADHYNGWTNYETWNLKLWIDNDQGLYGHWQEAAQTAFDATEALAEQIESDTREQAPECAGFYGDVLSAAIGAVDYREIAESLIEEVSE